MPQFIAYAREKGVEPDYKDIRISERVLLKTIKAYVARNIIDNMGFYPIIADIDQTLKVAIDTIATL
jgi:carboxyl-terminal processing protease